MSIVRDIGITLPAMTEAYLVSCAALLTTAASTSPALPSASRTTADALISPGSFTTGFGRVIDRLGAPLGAMYQVAMPAARLTATRGSTETDRQLKLGCYLLHGDSSGGGDMAEYNSESRPADRTYFGTGRTTDMANWDATLSTGALVDAASNPAYYDLRAAKRYLQVAVRVYKDKVTTESSGDEHARVNANVTLLGGDSLPQNADVKTSPFSTTTST